MLVQCTHPSGLCTWRIKISARLRFNFDACPMHSPFGFVHLTHQNLSVRALFCHNSLEKVSTQLLIYNECIHRMSSNVSKHIGIIHWVKYYHSCNTINLLDKTMFPQFDYCSLMWSNFTVNLHNKVFMFYTINLLTCFSKQTSSFF